MQFQTSGEIFPDAEIIEMHRKKDAPSGTAINTAKMIVAGRESKGTEYPTVETLPEHVVLIMKAFTFMPFGYLAMWLMKKYFLVVKVKP